MCTTSAGCVESGHNHREAGALMDPWKALYVCICGYGNWVPPFVSWPIWQGLWLGPCTDICICVWLAYDVYGSRVTMISETWPSCWTRSPGLALSPITKASWLVAHNCTSLTSNQGFSFVFQPSTTEGSSGVTLLHSSFSGFLCILNTYTGTYTQGISSHRHTHKYR